jgi:hypothetical protein
MLCIVAGKLARLCSVLIKPSKELEYSEGIKIK